MLELVVLQMSCYALLAAAWPVHSRWGSAPLVGFLLWPPFPMLMFRSMLVPGQVGTDCALFLLALRSTDWSCYCSGGWHREV